MQKQFHILLVEDNPSDVELFREALSRSESITSAVVLSVSETADEAWAHLSTNCLPDLVVLDYNLPGAKGNELLHRIRKTVSTELVPVVVMSSSRATRDIETAYRERCNAYILKPDRFSDLIEVVTGLHHFFGNLVESAVATGDRP